MLGLIKQNFDLFLDSLLSIIMCRMQFNVVFRKEIVEFGCQYNNKLNFRSV